MLFTSEKVPVCVNLLAHREGTETDTERLHHLRYFCVLCRQYGITTSTDVTTLYEQYRMIDTTGNYYLAEHTDLLATVDNLLNDPKVVKEAALSCKTTQKNYLSHSPATFYEQKVCSLCSMCNTYSNARHEIEDKVIGYIYSYADSAMSRDVVSGVGISGGKNGEKNASNSFRSILVTSYQPFVTRQANKLLYQYFQFEDPAVFDNLTMPGVSDEGVQDYFMEHILPWLREKTVPVTKKTGAEPPDTNLKDCEINGFINHILYVRTLASSAAGEIDALTGELERAYRYECPSCSVYLGHKELNISDSKKSYLNNLTVPIQPKATPLAPPEVDVLSMELFKETERLSSPKVKEDKASETDAGVRDNVVVPDLTDNEVTMVFDVRLPVTDDVTLGENSSSVFNALTDEEPVRYLDEDIPATKQVDKDDKVINESDTINATEDVCTTAKPSDDEIEEAVPEVLTSVNADIDDAGQGVEQAVTGFDNEVSVEPLEVISHLECQEHLYNNIPRENYSMSDLPIVDAPPAENGVQVVKDGSDAEIDLSLFDITISTDNSVKGDSTDEMISLDDIELDEDIELEDIVINFSVAPTEKVKEKTEVSNEPVHIVRAFESDIYYLEEYTSMDLSVGGFKDRIIFVESLKEVPRLLGALTGTRPVAVERYCNSDLSGILVYSYDTKQTFFVGEDIGVSCLWELFSASRLKLCVDKVALLGYLIKHNMKALNLVGIATIYSTLNSGGVSVSDMFSGMYFVSDNPLNAYMCCYEKRYYSLMAQLEDRQLVSKYIFNDTYIEALAYSYDLGTVLPNNTKLLNWSSVFDIHFTYNPGDEVCEGYTTYEVHIPEEYLTADISAYTIYQMLAVRLQNNNAFKKYQIRILNIVSNMLYVAAPDEQQGTLFSLLSDGIRGCYAKLRPSVMLDFNIQTI